MLQTPLILDLKMKRNETIVQLILLLRLIELAVGIWNFLYTSSQSNVVLQ